jgi:hypothetical protein
MSSWFPPEVDRGPPQVGVGCLREPESPKGVFIISGSVFQSSAREERLPPALEPGGVGDPTEGVPPEAVNHSLRLCLSGAAAADSSVGVGGLLEGA